MIIIPISGHIGFDVWPEDIRRQIEAANGEDIEIQVSSGGGFISDGLEIFNLIHDYPGKTTARIVGMAASMASYIPLAADRVIAKSNAVFMIHSALIGLYGNAEEHREAAEVLDGLSGIISDIYVKKTGKPESEIAELMKKDSYFFGSEMLDAGFVDEIEEIEIPSTAEDRANLLRAAKAEVKIVTDKVLASQDGKTKAAAYLAAHNVPPKPANPVPKTRNHEENMTFEEFCAKYQDEAARITAWLQSELERTNAEATLEDVLAAMPQVAEGHESAITDARTAVEASQLTEGEAKFLATALKSENYGDAVSDCIVDVFLGKATFQETKRMIAVADETAAKIAAAKINGNQPDPTPGNDIDAGDDTSVNSPKIQASVNSLKDALNNTTKVQ